MTTWSTIDRQFKSEVQHLEASLRGTHRVVWCLPQQKDTPWVIPSLALLNGIGFTNWKRQPVCHCVPSVANLDEMWVPSRESWGVLEAKKAIIYLTVPNRGCRSGDSNPRRRLVRYERTVFSRCEAVPQPRANCWSTQARGSNPDQSWNDLSCWGEGISEVFATGSRQVVSEGGVTQSVDRL